MANHPANAHIARELHRLATVMGIAGENPFRIRAIKSGSETVRELEFSIEVITDDPKKLTEIPGIGSGIAAMIQEIVETGTTSAIKALASKAPVGLIDIVELPGIGAKTALKLFSLARIEDLEGLQSALASGLIAATPGLGPKLAEKLQNGLNIISRRSGRTPVSQALPIAAGIARRLGELIGTSHRFEVTGSVRRWEETVDDINFLTTAPLDLIDQHAEAIGIVDSRIEGSVLIGSYVTGLSIVVIQSDVETWGTDLFRTTGPEAHLDLLGAAARKPFASETALFSSLGLPFIEPEFRQGLREIEKARNGELDSIVERSHISGEFHCHTTWSDGNNSIEEMAQAAREIGYHYLGISDHSHSLGVANGLSKERLIEQAREIRSASERMDFPILRSSEVEIKRNGSLDFDEETLHGLDTVVASTHSGLTGGRAELMQRLNVALSGGRVDLLAHPSGRLIGRREPGDFDWPAVYELAASRGVALEINADPARLDLNGEHAREAIEAGCLIAINCDAHSTSGFRALDFGIMVARRGFVPRERVINTWPLERLRAWLASPDTRA